MNLKKGNVFLCAGIWYVLVYPVVKDGKTYLNCICDHANNIHCWEPSDVIEWFDVIRIGFERPKTNRPLPFEVIAEVLAGQHDDRFEHWE